VVAATVLSHPTHLLDGEDAMLLFTYLEVMTLNREEKKKT